MPTFNLVKLENGILLLAPQMNRLLVAVNDE